MQPSGPRPVRIDARVGKIYLTWLVRKAYNTSIVIYGGADAHHHRSTFRPSRPPAHGQGAAEQTPGPADVDQIDAQVLRDPGVHATPADFGAGIGAAVADFGKAASRVASDFAEMRRAAEDDTAAAAALSEARARFIKVARSVNPQATTAGDFTGNLDRALGAETDAILSDLRQVRGLRPSKGGEAAIRRRLGLLASRMVARGAMFEQGERLAQLGRDVDLSVGDFAMAAFNRPADFPAIIEEMEAALDRFENKLPPGILAAKVAAARTTIGESAVAGLIEKDPATALAALEGGTFDRVLAPPGKALVLKRARAAVAVGDKAAGAGVAAAIEDHLVSLQTTGAGSAELRSARGRRSMEKRSRPSRRTRRTRVCSTRPWSP